MQEGEQEALDLILSQSADGRHGAATHSGATSLQLQKEVQHTHKTHLLYYRPWHYSVFLHCV